MPDYPELSPTPVKRPIFRGLARGLAALEAYAADPNNLVAQALPLPTNADRVGLIKGLVSFLGIPEAARFLDKLAYDEPLTTGKGQTLQAAPDVVEGALTLAPALTAGLAGAGKLAGKITPKVRKGQTNALLGGLAGDDPDLWLSHGAPGRGLLDSNDDLVRELYNPSFAITRDKLSTFSDARSVIVPWPSKLDPKNAKTLLTATDSYNPRWTASQASRIDNLPSYLDLRTGLADPRVNQFVNQRLFEKLGSPFPKQGIQLEGAIQAPEGALPRFMRGLAGAVNRSNPSEHSADYFAHRVPMSPRFQSLESFAQSPYGGKLIGDTTGFSQLSKAQKTADALFQRLAVRNAGDNDFARLRDYGSDYRSTPAVTLLKGLASDTHVSELLSRQKDPRFTFLDELFIADTSAPDGYRRLTKEERKQVQQEAGKALSLIKTAPSGYAELKAYGPWQVSADNVAGIVGRPGAPDDVLYKAAKDRGLPYEPTDTRADEVAAAKWMLSRKKGDTPPLVRGLARQPTPEVPAVSANASGTPPTQTVEQELFNWDTPEAASNPAWDLGLPAAGAGQKALAAKPAPTSVKDILTPGASPEEIMAALTAYHEKKPWYISLSEWQSVNPSLTDAQLEALANYSWAHTKSAQPHEKNMPALAAALSAAFK